jgi:hypothetical protein
VAVSTSKISEYWALFVLDCNDIIHLNYMYASSLDYESRVLC